VGEIYFLIISSACFSGIELLLRIAKKADPSRVPDDNMSLLLHLSIRR
jgi:hypothetical protein